VLRLTPNGDVFLRVHYSTNPSGSVMAEFDVTDEHMARLRKAIDEERFFDLPAEIAPEAAPLHQPDLHLEITLGGRKHKVQKHKVQLYDPAAVKQSSNKRRFLAVWARLYEALPLKPTW
jgi:hypothetical protein